MRKLLLSRRGKALVTLLLFVGAVLSQTCSSTEVNWSNMWCSRHCIITMLWFLFTCVHVWQHWALIKALRLRRVLVRNKITASMTLCFVLMALSILLFAVGLGDYTRSFHHVMGHIYVVMVVIHAVTKFRSFTAMAHRR